MTDYTSLINLISNVGFPIVIAVYLLHRFERKLDSLVENIQFLSQAIEKQYKQKIAKNLTFLLPKIKT